MAQLDRFLCKLLIDYPERQDEVQMLKLVTHEQVANQFSLDALTPVATPESILAMQNATSYITVDDSVQQYIVDIVSATRDWNGIDVGAGPRASISLLRAARGHAMLHGQSFVTPDNVKSMAPAVLRHRIQLTPDLEIEGYKPDDVVASLLNDTNAPRQ